MTRKMRQEVDLKCCRWNGIDKNEGKGIERKICVYRSKKVNVDADK